MSRLTMAFVFLLLASSVALGHNGALSLYTSMAINDCDAPSGLFETDSIRLYYVRSSGPPMGNAAEFRMALSSVSAIFSPSPAWSNLITVTLGDIESGMSITASGCLGATEPVVYLGEIYVFNLGEAGPFTVKVIPHPVSGKIIITICDAEQTVHEVLGGTFIFNGTCNPAVEASSWGAIKGLYR